jgi:hypothetical protein
VKASADPARRSVQPPTPAIRVLAWAVVAWCLGFAAVNLFYEASDRFTRSAYAQDATALSIINWLVVALKVLGAAVALLTVTDRWPSVSTNLRALLVWGAFALLGLYSVGNVVIALGLALGLNGSREEITAKGIGYVVFFLAGAAGYGALALSFSRRSGAPRRCALLGIAGAPLLLAAILAAIPALLSALGLLPKS